MEEVDFLVRCQRCKAMFLARSAEAAAAAKKRAEEIAAAEASLPTEPPRVHLADLLVRPENDQAGWEELLASARGSMTIVAVQQEAAAPRAAKIRRAQLHSRRQALGMIGILGLVGLTALAAGLVLLNRDAPRHASANQPDPLPTLVETQPAQPSTPDQPSEPAKLSDGELFPDVKAQK